MRGPLSHVHREQRDTEDRREKPRMWCSTVGGIVTLTLSLFLAPLCADAQSLAKVPRIGVISPVSPVDLLQSLFLQELRKLGYVGGQNILIDWRSYGGTDERARDHAADLVQLQVDALGAFGGPASRAAK